MNLRKMLAVFLLSLVAAFAFAFDGAIVGGRDGELARKDFLKAAADEDQMYSIVESFAKGARVLRFYHVDGDNMDKEDAALLDDVTAYIKGKYTVKNRESYSHIVTRGETLEGRDGWLVLSNYSASGRDKWFHYVYYFEIAD